MTGRIYICTFPRAVVTCGKEIMSKKGLQFPVQAGVGLSRFHHHYDFFFSTVEYPEMFPLF